MEVILMVGIPGCGKTALAKRWFRRHARISLDDIRKMPRDEQRRILKRHPSLQSDPRMDVARRVEYVLIDEALGRGESVAVDDTNLTRDVRRRHVNLAKMRGATVNVIYFTNNEQAFRQNDRRKAGLPVGALRKRRDELEPPETDEGFELVQIVPDVSWPDTSD